MPLVPTLSGLDRLIAEGGRRLKGRRLGLLCHAASVTQDFEHITARFKALGLDVRRVFGPEHGIWADAQDMIAVDGAPREPHTGAPICSLYGDAEESLIPRPEVLADLDVLVVDLQDIGSRYYTYIWTATLAARAAHAAGVEVLILDRPNPLGGAVEGGWIRPGFESFVGRFSVPTRHGLTLGEMVTMQAHLGGFSEGLEVLKVAGWRRGLYLDETTIPWVQPSPNMPTLETAVVYPGMCLIEGTQLSEGRGTTRPFELIGADFIEPFALAADLTALALPGIAWRAVYFRPTFHKLAGQRVGGVALHVTDRRALQPLRLGLHLLAAIRRRYGEALAWRAAPYEFIADRPALDLLLGDDVGRPLLASAPPPSAVDDYWRARMKEAEAFLVQRAPFEGYPP
ncbi:DUF1343 domain-containing protein [Myxococcota bacterium]|nr:DUF1343 domain-containing protein [Myxococcota bacterium]MBU1431479.1 DUF1343 domain-containing protein [Myxococcota bacterium]MBU1897628.1 DUF1343 domain-containing protein [Myxococcota bacterium]